MQDWGQGIHLQANWLFESNIKKHWVCPNKSYWPHSIDWRRLIQSIWRKSYYFYVFMQKFKLNRTEFVLWRTRIKNKRNDWLALSQDGGSLPTDVQDILWVSYFCLKTYIGAANEMGIRSHSMFESSGL